MTLDGAIAGSRAGSMQDLSFRLRGRFLPVDHAHALRQQILGALPWLADEPAAGIHQIHVAASGNGWQRPDDGGSQLLVMSRRTRLVLRLPVQRLVAAARLEGAELDLGGHAVSVGAGEERALRPARTLFARHVASEHADDEAAFVGAVREALAALDVAAASVVCGRMHTLELPGARLCTRSVMLDGCSPEGSLWLQARGLGPERTLGCGLFIPHKGVGPSPQPMDD